MNANWAGQNNGSGMGDIMHRYFNSKGLNIHEVPRLSNGDSTVYVIPTKDGYLLYNAVDGQTYEWKNSQQPYPQQYYDPRAQVPGVRSHPYDWTQNRNNGQSIFAPQQPVVTAATNPDVMDVDSGRELPGPCLYDPIHVCVNAPGPFQSALSRWTRNIREGLHIFTPEEVELFDPPESPTKFNADEYFNDELFNSLQGDVLPPGANPLDDYLRRHVLARHCIFMDAAVGNQGCCCEHENTPLDNYLSKNRKVWSAIGLRATVSDECRDKIREPVQAKPIKDMYAKLKAQAEQNLRDANLLFGNPLPDGVDPFAGQDVDDGMDIT